MRAILVCAIAILLSGCLRVGPGEDLHLVCEDKTLSPGPAYGVEGLLSLTSADNASIPEAERRAALGLVREHVITADKRPHVVFHANLSREAHDAFLFVANGTTRDGVEDEYRVRVVDGEAIALLPTVSVVAAPASVVLAAERVVARDSGVEDVRARTPTLVASGWDPALPGCVRLRYAESEESTSGTASLLAVNLAQGRVVDVERERWS